ELVRALGPGGGVRFQDAMPGMDVDQSQGDLVERRLDGRDLLHDVDAVAVLGDHAADAAHLALDAGEPLQELVLRGAVAAARRGRRLCHGVTLPYTAGVCNASDRLLLGPSGGRRCSVRPPPDGRTRMEQRRLGGDGPLVGAIALGAMGFAGYYGPSDDDEGIGAIRRALDVGITQIDTAESYGGGRSESLVGRAVATRRDDAVISTKSSRGGPAYLREAIDDSLGRLGTDHVDLYYLHRVDAQGPIQESL